MIPRITAEFELSFSEVPPGCFLGCDVPLPGARMGDVILLTEPPQRPPGLSLFAFVREPGVIAIACKNKTGDGPVSVPKGTYKVTIFHD